MMFESKVLIAFDKGSVRAALVPSGARAGHAGAEASQPLPEGALQPSPLEENIVDGAAVRDALRRLRQELGNGKRAALILPEGVARLQLLEPPPGVPPLDFARFRMTQGLPYAAGEALIDGLPAPPRGFLAAAVRRSVVRSYEAAAADAGFQQDRVELQSLAALAPLLKQPEKVGTLLVLVLAETAYALAGFAEGTLAAIRHRRRDRSGPDQDRLRDEIRRTSALLGLPRAPRILAVGVDSVPLAAALRGEGYEAASAGPHAAGHVALDLGVAVS